MQKGRYIGIAAKKKSQGIKLPDELLIAFAKYILPSVQEFYDTETGRQYYESFIREHPELVEDPDSEDWTSTVLDEDDDNF